MEALNVPHLIVHIGTQAMMFLKVNTGLLEFESLCTWSMVFFPLWDYISGNELQIDELI